MGKKILNYGPTAGGIYTVTCTHTAENMIENERVCSKTFDKNKEWICPEDKNLVAEINASPQVPGSPVLVLAGTPGSVICKYGKNGNEN